MTLLVHYHRYARSQLHGSLARPNMRIEHRSLNSIVLPPVTSTCHAISIALAGRTPVRWKEGGEVRRVVAVQPGIASILPVGFDETETEIVSPLESLFFFLAPSVTAASSLIDFDIDPSRVELVRVPAVSDPLLKEIATALHGVLSRPSEPTDRLFVEGASSMLTALLIAKYSSIAGRPAPRLPSLPYDKLKRVLDRVDCCFAEEIGLDDLAAEACLSPFHFSRLFQKATGLSHHRYVAERRVQEAKSKLAEGRLSLVEIALETGFGSQGNFNRIFRRHTGQTPGAFRRQNRGALT
jgi:AraC family transcriptional regulator